MTSNLEKPAPKIHVKYFLEPKGFSLFFRAQSRQKEGSPLRCTNCCCKRRWVPAGGASDQARSGADVPSKRWVLSTWQLALLNASTLKAFECSDSPCSCLHTCRSVGAFPVQQFPKNATPAILLALRFPRARNSMPIRLCPKAAAGMLFCLKPNLRISSCFGLNSFRPK